MTSRKNQHFVPQFYLRRFAQPGARRISLFNLGSRTYVPAASIRHQCSLSYLYSKNPAVEGLLAAFDEMHAHFFRKLTEQGEIVPGELEMHFALISFAVLQMTRTTARRADMTATAKEHLKALLEIEKGMDPKVLDSVELRLSDWAEGVVSGVEFIPITLDLSLKLIVNAGETGFVTSDNPVVLQNRYLTERGRTGGKGLACTGLQMIFPIDAKRAVVAFDEAVYAVGSSKAGVVQVSSRSDIRKLNELQILNALETVYFPPSFDEARAREVAENSLERRKPVTPNVTQYLEDGLGTGRFVERNETALPESGSMLIHSQPSERFEHHSFSFVTIRPEAKSRVLDSSQFQARIPALADAYRKFVESRRNDLREGNITLGDFFEESFAVLRSRLP